MGISLNIFPSHGSYIRNPLLPRGGGAKIGKVETRRRKTEGRKRIRKEEEEGKGEKGGEKGREAQKTARKHLKIGFFGQKPGEKANFYVAFGSDK